MIVNEESPAVPGFFMVVYSPQVDAVCMRAVIN
jgi:hypothetical protein